MSCLICWEEINNKNFVKCVNCNILLHNSCEERYRLNREYCKCPHCQKVGSLDNIPSRQKIIFDRNFLQKLKYNIQNSESHYAIEPDRLFGVLKYNYEKINSFDDFIDILKIQADYIAYSSPCYISSTINEKLSKNDTSWLEKLYNLCII